MGRRTGMAWLWSLTLAGPVWAQAPAPAPAAAAASAPRPPTSEAAAAMERAQRLAANPMRVIMQAGKIRRRTVEPDVLPDAADPASLRRVAVRPAAEVATPAAVPAAVAAVTSAVTPGATARVQPDAAAAPDSGITKSLVLQSAPLDAPAGGEVAPLQSAPLAPMQPGMPKMVVPQALRTALPVQPRLMTMVEPDIPPRVMLMGLAVNEVAAELSLRADGTVAEVNLLPPVPRAWQPYIIEALRQWRYEPLPGARAHRVQLIFNGQ